jgi:hypothetical protein
MKSEQQAGALVALDWFTFTSSGLPSKQEGRPSIALKGGCMIQMKNEFIPQAKLIPAPERKERAK